MAQILAEAKLLSTTCDPIVNKPKLKAEPPKDETKQDRDNKQDGKDDENTGQQPPTEQEDTTHNMSAGESQSTSNNTGIEYSMRSGLTDIDMDVERHFMNDKLIFKSVAIGNIVGIAISYVKF